jgi:hypothetical protein
MLMLMRKCAQLARLVRTARDLITALGCAEC